MSNLMDVLLPANPPLVTNGRIVSPLGREPLADQKSGVYKDKTVAQYQQERKDAIKAGTWEALKKANKIARMI